MGDPWARVARQGRVGPAPGGGSAAHLQAELDPEKFNDIGYRQVLRRLGVAIIDAEGPVTFDYLATRIARAHGFKRTGGQIRRQVQPADLPADRKSTRLNSRYYCASRMPSFS